MGGRAEAGSGAPFFREPSWRGRGAPEGAAPELDIATWARHFEGQLLDVDLVDEYGTPTSSSGTWSSAEWFAIACCKRPFLSPQLRPYIRNVALPTGLHNGPRRTPCPCTECLGDSPFPDTLGLDVHLLLFMGSAGSRIRLHTEAAHHAIRVLHGQKLVVMLASDVGHGLSAAVAGSINIVLCQLAEQAEEHFPSSLPSEDCSRRTGSKHIGSLVFQYDWLGPGESITIPQGWHHFVHNQTSCISVNFWARSERDPELRVPDSSSRTLPSDALAALPRVPYCFLHSLHHGLLTLIIIYCLDHETATGGAVIACGISAAGRELHRAACSDDAWRAATCHHFGKSAEALTAGSGSTWRERHICLRRRLAQEFARKPRAALRQWLIDPTSPEEIAGFLHRHRKLLDKQSLGDALADSRSLNQQVLRIWAQEMSSMFCGLSLEASLRIFLGKLMLPGKASRIDRLLEVLAQEYFSRNPEVYSDADVPFMLSFALIMLSSDLHNSSVKRKTTPEQFISSLRGIDAGRDLSRECLLDMYCSIEQTPIRTG